MKTYKLLGIIFSLMLVSCAFAEEYGVSLTVSPEELSVNPYEIAVYDILVENVGSVDGTYTVSIENIPDDWYSLSHDSVDLKAGETKIVYLFITPQPTEQDIYNGVVKVDDIVNASVGFRLNIIKDHKITVSMPRQLTSCICEEDYTVIVVENMGKYSENIGLFLSGDALGIIGVEIESFTIEPNETKQIPVTIESACDTEERIYNLEISIESTNSYASSSIQSSIKKTQCFEFQLNYPEEVRTCAGVEKTFQISVSNTGIKEDGYEVNIEELGYSDIISLEPGQTQDFEITFVKWEEGVYEIPFSVSSNAERKEGLVRFIVEKCFGVDLQLDEYEITIQAGTGKLTKPSVKNIGTRPDTFDIESSATWVAVRPESLTLSPNESQNIFVYYSPEYGTSGQYDVRLTVESDNAFDSETLQVNVEGVGITPEVTTQEEIIPTTTIEEMPTTTVEENITTPEVNMTTTVDEITTTTIEEIPEPPEIDILRERGIIGLIWSKIVSASSCITQKVEELKLNRMMLSLVIGFVVALIILIIIYLVVMRD